MTKVRVVEPDGAIGAILAGSHFIDAYRAALQGPEIEAGEAARLMFARQPIWIAQLLDLRNMIVKPLGLKTGVEFDDRTKIGFFPVQSITPARVVLGFDDKHLDFRVVVDVAKAGAISEVTLTTLVLLHNLLGRVYLKSIMPFHRLIAKTTLSGLAKR